ncbi:uncharacterized protein [Amphiura filiformis]|uniref:uncharacterized protein n=1 Tax=Amphiura filiformis TaxID=82378 RepID=UPI003B216339
MAAKRAFFITTLLCIQVFFVYSQSAKPAVTQDSNNEENRDPKHATSNKSFFDLPVSIRRLPEEITRGDSYGYTDFGTSDADDIVKLHNHYRGNTVPPAADMKHMSWDGNLATMAQNWADKCIYEHGGFEPNLTPFSNIGQNIFVGTGAGRDSGVLATELWHDEDQFYSYDTNSCRPGEVCGHYTQVVWADTSFVGCGRTFCSQVLVGSQWWNNAHLIVCNYGPGGNFQGELPFSKGERCSQCPNDAGFCTAEGLCRDCRDQGNEVETCGVCNRQCKNCGTLDEETCTCKCAPGWDGADCSEPCGNHHEWCGANPGWPTAEYCDLEPYASYTKRYCREMCVSCQPADGNFQCNPVTTVTEAPRIIKSTKYCKTSFTSVAVINQQLYAFKKEKFWRFDRVRNGRLLTSTSGDETRGHFKKVNPDVRAVYQRESDGKVLFFRGVNYWEYSEDVIQDRWIREAGFPKPIAEDLPGLPKSTTAALYDRFTSKTYFLKGSYVWRYDERRQRFDMEKELIDDVFNGLPSKITGAFQDYNGDYIFVKSKVFWRVRYGENRVESTEPQNLALAFMDCYE